MSGADRQRRRRARKAAGHRIWHLDLDIALTEELLADAGYLDAMAEYTEHDADARARAACRVALRCHA